MGYALAALRGARHDVPWQRVLGARPRGRATITILDPMGAAVQEAKLRQEGVRLDERGMIELDRYGWRGPKPRAAKVRRPPARGR